MFGPGGRQLCQHSTVKPRSLPSEDSGNQLGATLRMTDTLHPGRVLCRSWARVLQRTSSSPCAHAQPRWPQNGLGFIRCHSREMAAWTSLVNVPPWVPKNHWRENICKAFNLLSKGLQLLLLLLPSSSLYCSPHDRLINERPVVGARNSDFTEKAGGLLSQRTVLPELEFRLLLY